MGLTYYNGGNWDQALEIYKKSLKKARELDDLAGVSSSLCRLGIIYQETTIDYNICIEYFGEALSIAEKIKDNVLISDCIERLAYLTINTDESSSLNYFLRSLEIRKERNIKSKIAQSYRRLGYYYVWGVPDFKKSLKYFKLADKIYIEINNNQGHAYYLLSSGF